MPMVHTSSTRTQVGPAYTYRATARLGMLHAILLLDGRGSCVVVVLVLVSVVIRALGHSRWYSCSSMRVGRRPETA